MAPLGKAEALDDVGRAQDCTSTARGVLRRNVVHGFEQLAPCRVLRAATVTVDNAVYVGTWVGVRV